MFWSDTIVLPIILAQAALGFYYLVLPALSKNLRYVAVLAFGGDRQRIETHTRLGAQKTSEYRGKWRDAAYERDTPNEEASAPKRARPVNPIRTQHLRALGLRDPAHLMEVKHAYRSLAKVYHPDRYASPAHSSDDRRAAADKMREINQAYDWLCSNA
ncbi:MAG: J domain-containing protein [Pseudomonadota bacterium]